MADRIGQQVGNYRILRLLGRGGQASVYLGEHDGEHIASASTDETVQVWLMLQSQQ